MDELLKIFLKLSTKTVQGHLIIETTLMPLVGAQRKTAKWIVPVSYNVTVTLPGEPKKVLLFDQAENVQQKRNFEK